MTKKSNDFLTKIFIFAEAKIYLIGYLIVI